MNDRYSCHLGLSNLRGRESGGLARSYHNTSNRLGIILTERTGDSVKAWRSVLNSSWNAPFWFVSALKRNKHPFVQGLLPAHFNDLSLPAQKNILNHPITKPLPSSRAKTRAGVGCLKHWRRTWQLAALAHSGKVPKSTKDSIVSPERSISGFHSLY